MSGLPLLPRGQKYLLACCKCGGKAIVRGTTQIREPEGEDTWQANEQVTEYQCDRQTCKAVSYLVVRVTRDGVYLWWRDVKNDGVRTVLS